MTPLAAMLATLLGTAAGVGIRIEAPDRAIDAMRPQSVHVEPHLAIDPRDPDHWVVGTIVTAPDQRSDWHCAVLASFDGGRSWLRHDFDMGRCIDPWVLVFEDGEAVVTATEIQPGFEGDRRFVLLRAVSHDGGRTWSGQAPLGRTFEHAMAVPVADGVLLAARRTHYAAEATRRVLHVSHSADRLATLDARSEFVPAGESGGVMVTGLAPLGAGALVLSYTGEAPTHHVASVRSEDGGRSFSKPVAIAPECGLGEGSFGGYPFLAMHGDTLFHACTGDGYRGYWLSVSRDGGASWQPAVRVDDAGERAHVRTPMLAVGADGTVGMAWYDRRHDPQRQCQDLYFAASVDGGRTLLEAIRVSTRTSCPNAPGNGRAGARSWNSGGDYSSLAALPDGRFAVVWADSRSGRFQLRSAVVAVR